MSEPRLTPKEARQGRMGRPVLMVLIVSLLLGLVYVFSMLMFSATDELPPDGGVVESNELPAGGAESEPVDQAAEEEPATDSGPDASTNAPPSAVPGAQ